MNNAGNFPEHVQDPCLHIDSSAGKGETCMLPIVAALLLKTASIRAQVVLDASVAHLAAQPLSICRQNSVQPEKFPPTGVNPC